MFVAISQFNFATFKEFKPLSFIITGMKNSLSAGFNPDGLNAKPHYKPTALQDGKAGPEELVRLIRAMGHEPENVHFRFINKRQLNTALANGTDRDSNSINHNDGTSYEAMAMKEHGIYDGAYTSYLSDGANLLKPEADYALDTATSALILYRKDSNILSISPFKYLKVGERPSSFGFHIFKKYPSGFFIGAISAEGSEIAASGAAQTAKIDNGNRL